MAEGDDLAGRGRRVRVHVAAQVVAARAFEERNPPIAHLELLLEVTMFAAHPGLPQTPPGLALRPL